MKFTNKNNFLFFLWFIFLIYFFCNWVLSYFAKPNFIVYDEWFDNDFTNTKINRKNISNIHEFFYEKSNYKVGGSENNSREYDSILTKKFLFFETITKTNFNLISKRK